MMSNSHHKPQKSHIRTGSFRDDSLSDDSGHVSLSSALADAHDFSFDMNERWQSAYLEAMDDSIFPPNSHYYDDKLYSSYLSVSSLVKKIMTPTHNHQTTTRTDTLSDTTPQSEDQRKWTIGNMSDAFHSPK